MAMKSLSMLCIVFLLVSASLMFPAAEGTRTLEESKDGTIGYNPLNPKPPGAGGPGRPYTRPCNNKTYGCPP
ncbi:hypothetical protein FCM35_KLT01169 [Carex littledalei]|uniref:Uncharacterized protein n=1 Tax=Carex littledalei TaxID=544730 RepID=A0A833VSL3_9POAL|nr:hypothetical protein FCM35_KLT01169 [Carex littledalei]